MQKKPDLQARLAKMVTRHQPQPDLRAQLALHLYNQPLLLEQSRLDVMLQLIEHGARDAGAEPDAFFFFFEDPEPRDLDVREGIAVIDVHRYYLRARTYQRIRTQVEQALEATNVRGILLDIDTPGGEVAGLFDLADFLFEAREQKPIWSIANDDAFSAGYAIASGGERIAVTRTGGVGSVGVIAVHVEYSEMDARVGVKFTPIYSGERKADYLDSQPLGDTARALLQTEVDRLREIFVETVARNRGESADAIRDTEAGAFFGPGGVPLLADDVMNFDEIFEAFTSSLDSGRARAAGAQPKEKAMSKDSTKNSTTDEPEVTAGAEEPTADTDTDTPASEAGADVVDISAARAEAREEGAAEATAAAEERASRIRQACALAGCPERFGEFLDSKLTPDQVGKKLLEEQHANAGAEVSGGHRADDSDDAEPKIDTAGVYASRRS